VRDGRPPHLTGNHVVAGQTRGVGAVAVNRAAAAVKARQNHRVAGGDAAGTVAARAGRDEAYSLRTHAARNSKATASEKRDVHHHAKVLSQQTL
jgi:hypothetical protein